MYYHVSTTKESSLSLCCCHRRIISHESYRILSLVSPYQEAGDSNRPLLFLCDTEGFESPDADMKRCLLDPPAYIFSIYPTSPSAKPLHRTSPVRSLYSSIRLRTIPRSISTPPISLASVFLATSAFFFVTIVSRRILSLSSVFFCLSPIQMEPWRSSTSC
jgi:hypothetical protein